MRPWNIWWDFVWEGDHITHIVVQTDHASYKHLDYIYKIPIEECQDELGYVDSWVETWFNPFVSDLKSGRKSLHTIMKDLKHE